MAELPACIRSPTAALDALSALGRGPTLALLSDEISLMAEENSLPECMFLDAVHVLDAWVRLPIAVRREGLAWIKDWRR